MPRRSIRPLLLVVALLPAACALPTSRSNKVVLTATAAVVEACAKLGTVDGRPAARPLLLTDQARDAAIVRLKAATADLDGTHVLSPVAEPRWDGRDSTGTAYRCG